MLAASRRRTRRLKAEKKVSTEWVEEAVGHAHKYDEFTARGREICAALLHSWRDYVACFETRGWVLDGSAKRLDVGRGALDAAPMPLCPKCKSPTLLPFGVIRGGGEPDAIPPSRCDHCKGVWLPHEAIAAHLPPDASDAAISADPQADALPGFCPRCGGVLARARVESDHPFHLDRCPVCRGVWFDAGEWAAVASTEWLLHLDDLWDPFWRKRVREHRAENRHLETVRQALGTDAYEKVMATIQALRKHQNRSLGLSFIIEELRGP